MKRLLTLIFVCLFATNSLAQTAPPPPKQPAKPLDLSREGLRKWELKVADNAYQFNQSIENRGDLLHALERDAELTCLKKLPYDLRYEQKELSEECGKLLDRIFKHDPTNPTAICIRDGFKAVSCLDAFSNQVIVDSSFEDKPKYYQNTYGIYPLYALSDDKKSQDLAKRVSEECRKAKIALHHKKEEENYEDDILPGSSIFTQLSVKATPVPTPTKSKAVIKGFNEKAAAEEDLEVLQRVRVLSGSCMEAIQALENTAPFHSFVPCYRGGFYTPNCANQKLQRKKQREIFLRKQGKKKSKKKKKKSKPFTTF